MDRFFDFFVKSGFLFQFTVIITIFSITYMRIGIKRGTTSLMITQITYLAMLTILSTKLTFLTHFFHNFTIFLLLLLLSNLRKLLRHLRNRRNRHYRGFFMILNQHLLT